MTSHRPLLPALQTTSQLSVFKGVNKHERKIRKKKLVRPVENDIDSMTPATNDASAPYSAGLT
jgi:hypothetical protein